MKFISKAVETVKKGVAKVNGLTCAAMLSASTAIATVAGYCTGNQGIVDPNISADTLVSNIVGWMLDMFRYIGIILLVWGIGQLILAFKNEDGDSKSRAIMMCILAIGLITIKTVLVAIGFNI